MSITENYKYLKAIHLQLILINIKKINNVGKKTIDNEV